MFVHRKSFIDYKLKLGSYFSHLCKNDLIYCYQIEAGYLSKSVIYPEI